jgi:hypothetical protein
VPLCRRTSFRGQILRQGSIATRELSGLSLSRSETWKDSSVRLAVRLGSPTKSKDSSTARGIRFVCRCPVPSNCGSRITLRERGESSK